MQHSEGIRQMEDGKLGAILVESWMVNLRSQAKNNSNGNGNVGETKIFLIYKEQDAI